MSYAFQDTYPGGYDEYEVLDDEDYDEEDYDEEDFIYEGYYEDEEDDEGIYDEAVYVDEEGYLYDDGEPYLEDEEALLEEEAYVSEMLYPELNGAGLGFDEGAGPGEDDGFFDLGDAVEGEDDEEDTAELAEGLREVLHEDYAAASNEQLQEVLESILSTMTPAEGFSFKKALRAIKRGGRRLIRSKAVGKIAGKALPFVGGAVGTLIGGPVGTALGTKLGQVAGKAVAGASKGRPRRRGRRGRRRRGLAPAIGRVLGNRGAAALRGVTSGSPAALQLLRLTQNKNVLKGLMSLAAGTNGRSAIKLGGASVPLGGILNTLKSLTEQAAAEADALMYEQAADHSYLQDEEGEYIVDPSEAEERAEAVVELLNEEEEADWVEDNAPLQPWEDFMPFRRGSRLAVRYPVFGTRMHIGRATVMEQSPDQVRLHLQTDPIEMFDIPASRLTLGMRYNGEGAGNAARIGFNGARYAFDDVEMASEGNARRFGVSFPFFGEQVESITMTGIGPGEAQIAFTAGDQEHVLYLEEK